MDKIEVYHLNESLTCKFCNTKLEKRMEESLQKISNSEKYKQRVHLIYLCIECKRKYVSYAVKRVLPTYYIYVDQPDMDDYKEKRIKEVNIPDKNIVKNNHINKVYRNEYDLEEESPLHRRGYRVGANGLPENERRAIIRRVSHLNEMTKDQIAGLLYNLILKGRNNKNMKESVEDWISDLNWMHDNLGTKYYYN